MYKIISLGGSIVIPKTGFNIGFLKSFRQLILNEIKKGDKFILIIGGGATCRQYQNAAAEVSNLSVKNLDELGIAVTRLNAMFVKMLFGSYAHNEVVANPNIKVKTKKSIIIASGFKPGCSTDYDAVLFAKTYGAKQIINASNTKYVYAADPEKNENAEPILTMNWARMKKIAGTKWHPGANVPFDPLAVKAAQKMGLMVCFVEGTNLPELKNAIIGESFVGTVVMG